MGMFVTQTSFTRGEIDERAQDRADTELLRTGAQRMENFVPRLAGGVRKRPPLCLPFYSAVDQTGRTVIDSASLSFEYESVAVLVTLQYSQDDSSGDRYLNILAELYDLYSLPDAVLIDSVTAEELIDPVDFVEDIPFENDDSPLHLYINLSSLGPSGFITSAYFPMYRVFVGDTGSSYDINIEKPSFFKELYSKAFAYDSETLVLVDGANASILSTGDTLIFKGQEDTIDTIYGYEDTNVVDQWVYDDYPSARAITMSGTPYANLMVGRNAPLERPHQPLSNPFGGNPWLSTFHQGRLLVFSTRLNPTRMWAAKPQNPFVIQGPAEDVDSPIEYDLAASKAEGFTWVSAQDKVLLGTPSAEYALDSLSDQPLSPGNFGFYKVSEQGSSLVRPARADSGLFLAPRGRQAVSVFQYSDSVQGFQSQYLTGVVPELFSDGVERIEHEPPKGEIGASKLFTIVRWGNERALIACIYDRESEVIGWYRYALSADITPKDLVEINGSMYLVYTRSQRPGVYYSCLSKDKEFSLDYFVEGVVTLDSNDEYIVDLGSGDGPTTMEGETASMVDKDGNWLGEGTVQWDGSMSYIDVNDQDWPEDGMTVKTGLLFVSRMDMFPPTPDAEAVNRPIRNIRTLVSVYETADLWVNGISALQGPPKSGQPIYAEVSGTYEVRTLGWKPRPVLRLESTWPYPCTILSVTREVQV